MILNLVLNLIQHWLSISHCPESEILKRVQDDMSKVPQMFFFETLL